LGIGLNYRRHAEETKAKLPDLPVLFGKGLSSCKTQVIRFSSDTSRQLGGRLRMRACGGDRPALQKCLPRAGAGFRARIYLR
jgi:hypothetical protein